MDNELFWKIEWETREDKYNTTRMHNVTIYLRDEENKEYVKLIIEDIGDNDGFFLMQFGKNTYKFRQKGLIDALVAIGRPDIENVLEMFKNKPKIPKIM